MAVKTSKMSLYGKQHLLSKTEQQIKVLNEPLSNGEHLQDFEEQLKKDGLFPLKPTGIDIFQMNVGKMCNQVCKHCHVDAGPDRKEIMTKETFLQCLDVLKRHKEIHTIDLTGGAPEMNPHFRWFVEQAYKLGKKVMVRCNLTIILANPKYHDLPEFFKNHQVEVVSSLPHFSARRTDAQRGEGVFEKSIKALQMLNEVGYGVDGSGLTLNLVYNPSGAFLPGDQMLLQNEFKHKLKSQYAIVFNELFAITNIPVSRFLDYLVVSENYEEYMTALVNNYNIAAAKGVMCRNTVSIGWDGYLFDCDFNQMLDLKIKGSKGSHIKDFDFDGILKRNIVTNQHCYGCTAGAGSSCGGTTA